MSEKYVLLQVNATIVAGLLILLTITAISTDSILDLKIKSNLLNYEYQILLNDYSQIKNNIEISEGRQNVTAVPNTEGDGLVFSLPPPPPYLYAQEDGIDEIFQENYRDRVKTSAALNAYEKLTNFEILLANPIMLVSIMIIPFLISMLIDVKRLLSNSEHTSTASIILFMFGLAIMIAFFGVGIATMNLL